MNAPKLTEQDIFHDARRLDDPDSRRRYLSGACGGDRALLARVEALLRVHEGDRTFLHSPAVGGRADDPVTPPGEAVGAAVGPYTLVRQVGEGGMGVVFRAEQTHPVRRTVALKIIRPGMDTRPVLARLEVERQALALMDHPNIAKFLDAGCTDSGRPYIVMELVDGPPVTAFCDRHGLTVRRRLELFVAVCRGVQHAHQKGVIHRDLKPSNVLVARYDGDPVPKIIDFGLAKATGRSSTDSTLVTQFGLVVGTPAYMSPEQTDYSRLDVDTRADIYSLGALLYELLTGVVPLRWEAGRAGGLAAFLRAIRDDDPPRPSARVRGADAPPGAAAARGVGPKALARLVRGDLDWIVMRCLEKDRARRYGTAEALARDVERHLRDEPVEASPPGAGYRARKFARRHRAGLTTAAAFSLLLLAGAGASAWQAVRATAERDAKEVALQDEADQRRQAVAEKQRADEEAAVARAVEDFLRNDLLGQAAVGNQSGARDKNVTVRTLLDRAAARIDAKFPGQPLTEAAVRLTLGLAYRALGEYAEAAKHLERSLALRRAALGADHLDTAQAANNLASIYLDLGRYDAAEPLFRQAVAGWQARLGDDHPTSLTGLNNLAVLYQSRGRWDEAEPLLRRVLEGHRLHSGADHPTTLTCASNLGGLHLDRGQFAQAAEAFEPVLRARRAALGTDHPDTLASMNHLGLAFSGLRRHAEAEALFREALAGRRALLEADHPDTLRTMVNLGALYRDAGRYAEAEPLTRDAVAAARAKLAPDHPRLDWFVEALAELYARQGKADLAEPALRELAAMAKARHGPGSSAYAGGLARLALNLIDQGKFAEAEAAARDCLALRAARDPDGWATFSTRSLLGDALLGQKKYDAAAPLLADGYDGLKLRRAAMPAQAHVRLDESRERLARLHDARGDKAAAARVRGEAAPAKSGDQ